MHFTLCDMLSDLTQNAVEAGSSSIRVTVRETDRELQATIEDNGKGMTPAELKRAEDPFYTDGTKHPGRKVGLGIPFLIQTAESTGGSWSIKSNKQTRREARLPARR
ncbi:MAG TPA: sensor histidine kinase, partial [Treponemataceae bacterium]|nr:sensor histidine kinase [Treponemataceae bacterium]